MAEQNVVIKIQADVSKATSDVKALQQVIAKLSTSGTQAAAGTEKVSNAAKKTATASQLLSAEINEVVAGQGNLERVADLATKALEEQEAAARRLADVSKAVEGAVGKKGAAVLGASKQIGGLADASGAASFALLSLGQAFQDSAQFGMGFAQGFRAINNNIQQTFTAIALGSIQAGGFNNLLKLMGGSLWGPGGLILGFSAVSAAIEFFSTRAQRAERDAEKLSEEFGNLFSVIKKGETVQVASSKRLKDYRDGLKALEQENRAVADSFLTVQYDRLTGAAAIVGAQQEEAVAASNTADKYKELADGLREAIEESENYEEALAAQERTLGINGIRVENLTAQNEQLAKKIAELAIPMSEEAKALAEQNKRLQDQVDLLEFLKLKKENLVADTADRMSEAAANLERAIAKAIELPELKHGDLDLGVRLWTDADEAAVQKLREATPYISDFDREIDALQRTMARLGGQGIMTAMPELNAMLGMFNQSIVQIMSMPDPETLGLGKALETQADAVQRQNDRIRESFATLGADLITSFATIGGGFDMFIGTMGRFMSRYGREMIKHGLLTVKFGISIEAVKEALERFNGKAAIIAGLALVAIGSRLRSNARDASRRLQGGGGGSAARPNFTMPNPLTSPASFHSQGMFPATSNAPSFSGRFVASGRDLVAVVSAETDARQELGFTRNLVIGG